MIIQHMKNDFTLKVYETHARMALEKHDLDQFNQCQTQLVQLYADGIKGKEVEFLAYRIIYLALQNIKYGNLELYDCNFSHEFISKHQDLFLQISTIKFG